MSSLNKINDVELARLIKLSHDRLSNFSDRIERWEDAVSDRDTVCDIYLALAELRETRLAIKDFSKKLGVK